MNSYEVEAFKSLASINEEAFDIDSVGMEEFDDFIASDTVDDEDVLAVIDGEAEDDRDIKDSYVGKIILDCSVCHCASFKNADEVVFDEDSGLVCVGDICPSCYSDEGYTIIGKVAEFSADTEADVEVEVSADEDDKVDVEVEPDADGADVELAVEGETEIEEKVEEKAVEGESLVAMTEELSSIEITTDSETIEVEVTPNEESKENETEETAVEDELPSAEVAVDDTEEKEAEVVGEVTDDDFNIEDEEVDTEVSFDEIEEESFNKIVEGLLKRKYNGVTSFKATNFYENSNRDKLFVEGVITLKDGKHADAKFNLTEGASKVRGEVVHSSLIAEGLIGTKVALNAIIKDKKAKFVESFKTSKRK